jgi:hypothetical protein
LPEPSIQSDPPLVKRMMRSFAMRLSNGSSTGAAAFWCVHRQAGMATWWLCMANASAVEPQ